MFTRTYRRFLRKQKRANYVLKERDSPRCASGLSRTLINGVPRRRFPKYQTRVPLMSDVRQHPIDHRGDAIAKTYQEKNVEQ